MRMSEHPLDALYYFTLGWDLRDALKSAEASSKEDSMKVGDKCPACGGPLAVGTVAGVLACARCGWDAVNKKTTAGFRKQPFMAHADKETVIMDTSQFERVVFPEADAVIPCPACGTALRHQSMPCASGVPTCTTRHCGLFCSSCKAYYVPKFTTKPVPPSGGVAPYEEVEVADGTEKEAVIEKKDLAHPEPNKTPAPVEPKPGTSGVPGVKAEDVQPPINAPQKGTAVPGVEPK